MAKEKDNRKQEKHLQEEQIVSPQEEIKEDSPGREAAQDEAGIEGQSVEDTAGTESADKPQEPEAAEQSGDGGSADIGEADGEEAEEDIADEETADAETDADEAGDDGEDDDADAVDGEWKSLGGEQPADSEPRKGFFRKKKDRRDQQIEELTDRVRRQMAEFDNFRKRTEKEKAAMYEVGAKSVIEKILPVVDNFERGLAAAGESEDPFVEGMEKIYKQLMTTLEGLDVKPIEAVGQTFNPDLHNAVMHVEDESVGENVVVEELQRGYTYRDSVVRYSMVKVAN